MENDKECIHDINDVENLTVDKVTQSSGEAKIKARMETSPNIRGDMKTQIGRNNLRRS